MKCQQEILTDNTNIVRARANVKVLVTFLCVLLVYFLLILKLGCLSV